MVWLLQNRSYVDQVPLGSKSPTADVTDPAWVDELFEKEPALPAKIADYWIRPLAACRRLDPPK